ncbi:MAG TPA: hypothetical protein VJX67_02310 [Blastocatellia bacterium]|nr:hypothetical protein [Blastocatellia bacterium]
MSITLQLGAADLDADDLHDLTRQLCRDLIDEAGVKARLAEGENKPGLKGDLPVWGQIVISALGAGGFAVALVNVLKVYVQRKPSLQFELRKKNGDSIKIKADDLRPADNSSLIQVISEAMGDGE